jgi:hypothetical protein
MNEELDEKVVVKIFADLISDVFVNTYENDAES